MSVTQSRTIWEKLGAAEGLWAAALLGANFYIMLGVAADPAGADGAFATTLLGERQQWEWMTFLRIVAGLMIIWWMGSLAGRLRLAEGEPGRLATIALGVGTVWGALWLVSALFNSASILLAADYANPAGARFAAAMSIETMYVLTPAILFVLTLATWLVGVRFGGFPRWYTSATMGTSFLVLVLALVDWYGAGTLSLVIMLLALAWMAVTSGLLIAPWSTADPVLGTKERAAAR